MALPRHHRPALGVGGQPSRRRVGHAGGVAQSPPAAGGAAGSAALLWPGADGYYFASLPEGLPGQVQEVADNSTRVLAYERGELGLEGEPIELGLREGEFNHLNTL